jgi:hypothetical protein
MRSLSLTAVSTELYYYACGCKFCAEFTSKYKHSSKCCGKRKDQGRCIHAPQSGSPAISVVTKRRTPGKFPLERVVPHVVCNCCLTTKFDPYSLIPVALTKPEDIEGVLELALSAGLSSQLVMSVVMGG